MRSILVIRFGALGDLCLLAGALARAARAPGAAGRRVTLVTKAAFAPLLAEAAGVDRVIGFSGGLGDLAALAGRLRRERFDTVIDAHHILRGHLLLVLMGRRPDARLAKDTAARLAVLRGAAPGAVLARTMRDRFADLLPALTGGDALPDEAPAALQRLARPCPGGSPVLGLAPGARWPSKRWPEAHAARLVRDHAAQGGRLRIFLGPDEEAWFAAGPLAAAARDTGAEVVQGRPLVEVAGLLSECAALVTNDSGLLHLAEAVGTPVVALFGPTVRAFGYAPHLPASRLLETDGLDCRPCSRNGKRPCHRGDLACLDRIAPDTVAAALAPLLALPPRKDPA
ncbi:MAG TPA: glycosyltransferase family 9 protein [Candidatus Krumholzibacteria bacterium]|nr:glycosyltransferase family 9 protein [Candidatus Krumholzibacteria bacterium]